MNIPNIIPTIFCKKEKILQINNFDKNFPSAEDKDFIELINNDSVHILKDCKLEPALKELKSENRIQFERIGYYCVDNVDSVEGKPVFNRTVGLRDEWARLQKRK
jgi:glutaminyl-tRNA synthetase